MVGGSSFLVFVLGIGMMFTLLYFSMAYSPDNAITTKSKLSQDDAIRIADADLSSKLNGYTGIKGIIDNNMSRYVPFDEFKSEHSLLPLIYVHPNGSLIQITANGYRNFGYCNSGTLTYCGYMPPYGFDYEGKLVYAVEVETDVEQIL